MVIPMIKTRETDLYLPVKDFLEAQGYVVKSEIGAADVMAVRRAEKPIIVELKLSFSLKLVNQCVARLKICDDVYMAVAQGKGKRFLKTTKDMAVLCRRLGIGLMTVRLVDSFIQIHCDPGYHPPRKNLKRKKELLREFARRQGDPNDGGQTRFGLITAYRQDALKIALYLRNSGVSKGSLVVKKTGVEKATTMMRDNHYGWFERINTGIYQLTRTGEKAVSESGSIIIRKGVIRE